jgi:hypothetical protein
VAYFVVGIAAGTIAFGLRSTKPMPVAKHRRVLARPIFLSTLRVGERNPGGIRQHQEAGRLW